MNEPSEAAKLREELAKAHAERDAAYSLARSNDFEQEQENAKLREGIREACRAMQLGNNQRARNILEKALSPEGPAQQKGKQQ